MLQDKKGWSRAHEVDVLPHSREDGRFPGLDQREDDVLEVGDLVRRLGGQIFCIEPLLVGRWLVGDEIFPPSSVWTEQRRVKQRLELHGFLWSVSV